MFTFVFEFCKIENCKKLKKSKGMCSMHYNRVARHGNPNTTLYCTTNTTCIMENCSRVAESHNLCSMHAKRKNKHGDPSILLIEKQQGKQCKVIDCFSAAFSKGYCSVHYGTVFKHGREYKILREKGTGTITKDGYKEYNFNGNRKLEHVMLAEEALGKKLPSKAVVHHMNSNKLDNFTSYNLVICPDQAYHMLLHKRIRAWEAKNGKKFT